MSKFWTEERTDEAVRLWRLGQSAGMIGKALGCSRNSCIGKLHRLGHSHKARIETAGCLHLTFRYPEVRKLAKPKGRRMKPKTIIEPPPPAVVPVFSGVGRQCCYPWGDPRQPGFYFCPNRALPGESYCRDCRARCYSPVPPRRVRRA